MTSNAYSPLLTTILLCPIYYMNDTALAIRHGTDLESVWNERSLLSIEKMSAPPCHAILMF